MRNILLFPRRLAASLIRGYQSSFSPDHGPLRHLYPYGYCRHHPTCSQYARQVIERQGVVIGGAKTLWRLLHCTPWHKPSEKKILQMLSTKRTLKRTM